MLAGRRRSVAIVASEEGIGWVIRGPPPYREKLSMVKLFGNLGRDIPKRMDAHGRPLREPDGAIQSSPPTAST